METEIINYIREAQKHGLTETEIKQNLLDAGWDAATVENSFSFVKVDEVSPLLNQNSNAHFMNSARQAQNPAPQALPSQQQLNIAEQHSKQQNKPGFFKRPVFWIAFLVLIGLGAGGYFAYAYVYNNPQKVWKNFSFSGKPTAYSVDYKIGYSDNVKSADATTSIPSAFTLNGTGYFNPLDQSNRQSSADFTIGATVSGASVSKDFKYLYFNNNFFLYFGQLPAAYTSFFNGKNYEWLKLDMASLNELFQQTENNSQNASGTKTSLTDYKKLLQTKLAPIWQQVNLVKMDKYLGKEKIGDADTYHFKNSLDKQALVNAVNNSISVIISTTEDLPDFSGEKVSENDKAALASAVLAFTNKIQVKEFETWIGAKDLRLYKIHFVSNALSINALENNRADFDNLSIFDSSKTKERDAKRVADLGQFATALELYYNDFGGYPDAYAGKPVNITPKYMLSVPETLTPADGTCSDWYNTYWYRPTGKSYTKNGVKLYQSYEFETCLGNATKNNKSGIIRLTPQGLQSGIPCTDGPDKCTPSPKPSQQAALEQIKQQIEKLNFSAEFKLDVTYSNFGQIKNLSAPAEYFDVIKELQNLLPNILGLNTNIKP